MAILNFNFSPGKWIFLRPHMKMIDFIRFTSLENVKFQPYADIFPHMYGKVLFFYFYLKQMQQPKKLVKWIT